MKTGSGDFILINKLTHAEKTGGGCLYFYQKNSDVKNY
jgi:hypothetical protein